MYPVDLLKVRACFGYKNHTDRFKTRMQVINPSPGAIYSGLTNAMTTIARLEGFQSLWRGMTSVIVGAGMHGYNLHGGMSAETV